MKAISPFDAGSLMASMKRRASRLRTSAFAASLLHLPLRARQQNPPTQPSVSPSSSAVTISPTDTTSRRRMPLVRTTSTMQRVLRQAHSLARRLPAASSKLPRLAGASRSAPSVTGASSLAPLPTPHRPMMLTRAPQSAKSVVGPVLTGAASRVPSLLVVARALTPRLAPARGEPMRSAASQMTQPRSSRSASRASQQNRPASALAFQTRQKLRELTHSSRPGSPSRSIKLDPSSPTSNRDRGGDEGRGRNGDASSGENGGAASIVLSGDFIVDGRRLGELALTAASRGGSPAQSGARTPNFRRTALPSGIAAPLP